jgi:hypothetical protein
MSANALRNEIKSEVKSINFKIVICFLSFGKKATSRQYEPFQKHGDYTDKKRKENFLMYKEIQRDRVQSHM